MPKSKNTLTEVGPTTGQLKKNFSNLEKIQLSALHSGALGSGAGNIRGDVAQSLSNITNTNQSSLELGLHYAENFENTGLTRETTKSILNNVLSPSIANKRSISTARDPFHSAARTPDQVKKNPTEVMKDKKESIVGESDFNYGSFSFPADLQSKAHSYIELLFAKYDRTSPQEPGSISEGGHIYLPLPENLEQTHSIKYGEQDIGALGNALETETVSTALQNIKNISQGGGEFNMKNVFGGIEGGLDTIKSDVGSVVSAAALNMLSSTDIGGLVGQQLGMIPNPHPTVFFQGMELRKWAWQWKLVPRNKEDAKAVKNIIAELKKRCLPKKKGSFLTYPDMIKPYIKNSSIGNDYKWCVVSSFSTNYSAEGTSAFFEDGNPVSTIITIEFQEVELYIDEDSKSGDSK